MFGVSHAVQMKSSACKVIVEVLVLILLVVVYKIPYSCCMYVNQVRCNWCVPIVLLSIWYNVCAYHSPVGHYIAVTIVYQVQCIIAACVII